MQGRSRSWGTFAAALIALLMLSYASVQSTVMQTVMLPPVLQPAAAMSDDAGMSVMAEMATAPVKLMCGGVSKSGRSPTKICPYCAAAAHPPLIGVVTPWRAPSVFTFAAFRVVASHGPRGPPVRQPRARGPPADPLTV